LSLETPIVSSPRQMTPIATSTICLRRFCRLNSGRAMSIAEYYASFRPGSKFSHLTEAERRIALNRSFLHTESVRWRNQLSRSEQITERPITSEGCVKSSMLERPDSVFDACHNSRILTSERLDW